MNGVPQEALDGVSFAYCFDDPSAEGRLKTQYFEILGSRGIYYEGWMASTFGPRVPWVRGLPPGIHEWTPDKDTWELYNLDEDWSQAHDLALEMPDKVERLKELFLIEAAKNKALPIGGGLWIPLFIPSCARPRPTRSGPSSATPSGSRSSPPRPSAPGPTSSGSRRSFLPTPTACSTSWAGSPAASPLRRGRRPLLRVQPVRDPADQDPRAGEAADRLCDSRDRDEPPRADATRSNERDDEGERPARREGTVPITTPIAFTANECLDFGISLGSPVSLDYYDKAPFKFNGTIERVYVRYATSSCDLTEHHSSADSWPPRRAL